jgi:hypothetical protein
MRSLGRLPIVLLAFVLLGGAIVASPPAQAATFLVINNDGAGEGFNDATPAAPVGGNAGTTIGQQRLIAFQHAANIWGARLASPVTIRVQAQFNPLSCSTNSAVLGSAGFINAFRDFTGAPVAGTWYPIALANALSGSDLDPTENDINAQFNSNLGNTGCLESSGWYYGLDGTPPGNLIDFVTVLLHELGHGLGVASLVNLATGAKALGFNDAYMRHLEHHGASPPDYPSMTDAQRVAASTATGNLHWTGANIRATSGILTAGAVGDHVRMNAPNPQQPGSSVSHFDPVATPNQLMEPSYTVPIHSPVLELPLFRDIGWTVLIPPSGDFDADAKSDILLRHVDNGRVRAWLLNGGVIKATLDVDRLSTNWEIAGIGDVDGDGKADVVFRHVTNGRVRVWLLNGGAVKAEIDVDKLSTTWAIAGVGDVDGDGRADIIFRHTTNGRVRVWLLDGGTVKAKLDVDKLPTAWAIAGVGDVDGDGKVDIVARNTTSGRVRVWLLNGGAVKANLVIQKLPTAWEIAGVGDVDGDGKADIVVRSTTSGRVRVWLMNGGTIKAAPDVDRLATTWAIAGVADVDGDNKADIVFRHTNSQVRVWLLNGGTIKNTLDIAKTGAKWTIAK